MTVIGELCSSCLVKRAPKGAPKDTGSCVGAHRRLCILLVTTLPLLGPQIQLKMMLRAFRRDTDLLQQTLQDSGSSHGSNNLRAAVAAAAADNFGNVMGLPTQNFQLTRAFGLLNIERQ